MRNARHWFTEETSFVVLRALAMLGGMVAILLVPHPPEHQPYLGSLAWGFVAYKVGLFAAIWAWPRQLRGILLASVCADLIFVALFVWFGGGLASHFYLLFYLLVALVAAQFPPAIGLGTAGAAGGLYAVATLGDAGGGDWHHLVARVATFFLLAGSVGYLSQRERLARSRVEALNRDLQENQGQLQQAYRELQTAQERLVRSERLAAIGQMSAKVSHEVRNPLSSISLNVELLEDELASLSSDRGAEAKRLVAAVRSQVDVLSAVSEDYLRFARLPKPRLGVAALGPVVEDLADFVRAELRVRRVQLRVDVDPGLPMLRLDTGQIRQALLNLVRNASEAMPDGGTIRVAVAPGPPSPPASRRSVEVTVTDTGRGILPEDVEQVFEPFFTRKEGGTGLGLAISREIAAGHGGTLTCEPGAGQGTTFRLTLPVPEAEDGR